MLPRLLLVLLLPLTLAACNRDNVDVQRNGDGTATITVTVQESEVNTMIVTALERADDPLLRNPSVDLQDGRIVVSGDYERQDGGGTVSGTMTLTATVVNGSLQIQVTDVTIQDFSMDDARIAEFNQNLAEAMAGRARQDNPRATLQSVTITDNTFSMTIVTETRR